MSSRARDWLNQASRDLDQAQDPTDILVYTQEEWQSPEAARKFFRTLAQEAVWVYLQDN